MYITSAGNVGIGTSSPASTLTVSDGTTSGISPFGNTDLFLDSSGSNYLQFGSGSASAASIYFGDSVDGDAGAIIYNHSSDYMSFRANAAERMRINSSGNVGIGTTAQANKLEVSGAIVAQGAATAYTNTGLYLQNKGSSVFDVGAWRSGASVAELTFSTDSGSDAAPVERMRITSTGDVGIGTSSPASKLHLSSGSPRITLTDTGTGADHRINADSSAGNLGFEVDYNSDTASPAAIFTIKGSEKLRITSTGNVGIGTSSPTYKLESSGSTNTLKLVNGTTYDLRFVEQNSLTNIYSYGSLDLSINTRYSNDILFKTADAERMRIDSSGRVTTPNQPSFRANKTVDQTSGFPGTVTVTWDSMAYDVGSNFNLGTSKFTAPVTGKYAFSAGLRVDLIDTAAGYYVIKIATSNANYQWIIDPNYVSDLNYTTLTLSTIADMDASDTAFVQIQQSGGHATTHIHGSLGYDWFCGHLLG
jgi:hypothetical protein